MGAGGGGEGCGGGVGGGRGGAGGTDGPQPSNDRAQSLSGLQGARGARGAGGWGGGLGGAGGGGGDGGGGTQLWLASSHIITPSLVPRNSTPFRGVADSARQRFVTMSTLTAAIYNTHKTAIAASTILPKPKHNTAATLPPPAAHLA